MKKAIIVGTFPTDKTTEEMLVSCIESVKRFGWDIFLTSHKALPQHIVELVDYYIYDGENVLDPIDLTPVYWYHSDVFSVQINGRGHIVPVTRNMKNSIGLLDVLGYGFFYYLESDNIISLEDVNKLTSLASQMSREEKEIILFKINEEGNARYESLMFGGSPHFFLNNAQLPSKADDIRKYNVHPTLEDIFYTSFRYKEDQCLIINQSSKEVLHTSEINIIANHHKAEVIKDYDEDRYFLWVSNSPDNPMDISFKINGNDGGNIPPNGYYYQQVNVGDSFQVEIVEGVQTILKLFSINELNFPKFAEMGYINFKK
jgi:hypothetical protein